MTAVVYTTLGVFGISAIALWIYCLYDLSRCVVFSNKSKAMWLLVIILAPVGGLIAYLSAKKNVEKFSLPDAGRIARIASSETEEA